MSLLFYNPDQCREIGEMNDGITIVARTITNLILENNIRVCIYYILYDAHGDTNFIFLCVLTVEASESHQKSYIGI